VIDELYKILLKTSPRHLAVLVVGDRGRNVLFILSYTKFLRPTTLAGIKGLHF